MSRAAGRDGAEGRHQAAGGLPKRSAGGSGHRDGTALGGSRMWNSCAVSATRWHPAGSRDRRASERSVRGKRGGRPN
jgi:hypothetical protein